MSRARHVPLREGHVKKGGVGKVPTTPRPPLRPAGQGAPLTQADVDPDPGNGDDTCGLGSDFGTDNE